MESSDDMNTYSNLMMLFSKVNDEEFSTTETAATGKNSQVIAIGKATFKLSKNIVRLPDRQSADGGAASASTLVLY